MKKYISLLALALVFGVMTSCDSDPSDTDTNPGGTAVKKMCGDWIVTAYTCENQGDVADIDNWNWEELGAFSSYLLTYNTAANKSTEMWVDDNGELALGATDDYSHKVKVNVRYGKRTFSVENAANEYTANAITIVGGKVLHNAARNANNVKVDSIVYYVKAANTTYGYIKVSGIRNDF